MKRLYHSPRRLRNLEPGSQPLLLNVEQISPAAAEVLFFLDYQLVALKTNTLVPFPSLTVMVGNQENSPHLRLLAHLALGNYAYLLDGLFKHRGKHSVFVRLLCATVRFLSSLFSGLLSRFCCCLTLTRSIRTNDLIPDPTATLSAPWLWHIQCSGSVWSSLLPPSLKKTGPSWNLWFRELSRIAVLY